MIFIIISNDLIGSGMTAIYPSHLFELRSCAGNWHITNQRGHVYQSCPQPFFYRTHYFGTDGLGFIYDHCCTIWKVLHKDVTLIRVKTTLSAIIITDNYFTVQIFTEIIVSYLACGQLFVGYVTNVEDRCVYRIPENHILIWAALSMSFRRISINKQNSLRSPSNIWQAH